MNASSSPAESRERTLTFWSDTSLIGVAVIWGVNIPIMKNGLEQLDLYVFNAIRLTISAVVLVLFAWRELRRGIKPKPGLTFKHLLLFGLVMSAMYQILFLLGVSHTTSGNTALIISTVPMWTALLARLFLCEKLRILAWSGLTIALVGTVIVALQKGDVSTGLDQFWGNLFILGAALLWASGTVYSRPLLTRISPVQLSASAAVIALPVHLLIAAGRYEHSIPVLQSVDLWLIILYSGVLSSGLALPMWNLGVRHAGAAHAAVIQNLVPLVAIIAAWLTRGEPVTQAQILGGSLILSGVIMVRRGRHAVLVGVPERDLAPDSD